MDSKLGANKMNVIKTATGLRHTASSGRYSGEIAEKGESVQPSVKRGRGRPRKNTGETGSVFDFTELTKVLGATLHFK